MARTRTNLLGHQPCPGARGARICRWACGLGCVDTSVWLNQTLGDARLDDGRTRAQVVVGQAEFADVAVLNRADPIVAAVLRRLAPRARIRVGADGIEQALDNLYRDARRGRSDDPH